MLSPSQSFCIPLARREESFSIAKASAPPPLPPPSQGGEKDRSLAPSFHPAQQKHASRNRPSSSVKTNFAACQRAPAINPSLETGLVHAQKPSEERVINSCLLAEPLDLVAQGVLGLLLEKIGNGLELHDTLRGRAKPLRFAVGPKVAERSRLRGVNGVAKL